MTTSDVLSVDAEEHLLFPFPRLSRKVNRDLWADRFVNSMLMRGDGTSPNCSWTFVRPDNIPEGLFVAEYFDVIAVWCEDSALIRQKYVQYAEHMEREYRLYAQNAQLDIDDMDRFCAVEPFTYRPSGEDVEYSGADRSSLESMSALYQIDTDTQEAL